jgi:hypothetical protein
MERIGFQGPWFVSMTLNLEIHETVKTAKHIDAVLGVKLLWAVSSQ